MHRSFRRLTFALLAVVVYGCSDTLFEDPYGSAPATDAAQTKANTTSQTPVPNETVDSATAVGTNDDKELMTTLKELGVIFSKNSDKTRVSTINFTTLGDREAFEAALEAIGNCSEMNSINMNSSLVTDKDLKKISHLKSVTSLTLNKTGITDEGVKHISKLENLETLYLGGTGITNASLPIIGKLKRLRILEVSSPKITGGLEPLAMLPQLSWLLLRGVTIKDDSLASLKANQSLSRLTLSGSTIEDKGSLATLRSSAPNISIQE